MKKWNFTARKSAAIGYSLLEVLIAMTVFGFGILAFMQLQGHLNRVNLDARIRTMAANIAEEHIEMQERFTRLATDADGAGLAYQDISSDTTTLTRGGIQFTIQQTVTDYYWDADAGQFSYTASSGSVFSDFKHLEVSVSWQGPEFNRGDDTGTSVGRLGSGDLEVSTVISSKITATNHLALLDELAIQGLCIPMVSCL